MVTFENACVIQSVRFIQVSESYYSIESRIEFQVSNFNKLIIQIYFCIYYCILHFGVYIPKDGTSILWFSTISEIDMYPHPCNELWKKLRTYVLIKTTYHDPIHDTSYVDTDNMQYFKQQKVSLTQIHAYLSFSVYRSLTGSVFCLFYDFQEIYISALAG